MKTREYETLLNPAMYVFSIWTLIYTRIAIPALYQAQDFYRSDPENKLLYQLSGWFMLANLTNGI
jgi:hypothetical protein